MTGRKGMFGPLVIGEQQAAQERVDVAKGIDYFGPSVVGPSEPVRPTAQQLRDQPGLAAVHGLEPGKVAQPAGAALPGEPQPPANKQLSLKKLTEALDANPFMLNGLIDAEFERPEGPRKAALRLFIKEENKKSEETRRVDVLEKLMTALKPPA